MKVTEDVKPFKYFTCRRLNTLSKTPYPKGSLVMISTDDILDIQPVDHILGFIDSSEEIKVKLIFD